VAGYRRPPPRRGRPGKSVGRIRGGGGGGDGELCIVSASVVGTRQLLPLDAMRECASEFAQVAAAERHHHATPPPKLPVTSHS